MELEEAPDDDRNGIGSAQISGNARFSLCGLRCQASRAVWASRAGRPRGSPGQRWGYFTILIVRNIPSWKCSRPSSAFIAQAIT
jgi:hypothetical protein